MEKHSKEHIIKTYAVHDKDTGSVAVQVALLTERINHLTAHFQKNKHDYASKRGLLKMVWKRKKSLEYLSKKDVQTYKKLLEQLDLRK